MLHNFDRASRSIPRHLIPPVSTHVSKSQHKYPSGALSNTIDRRPMPWFYTERGPPWKRGWTQQTLSSLTLPPPHLIALLAIVVLFLSMSWHLDYKTKVARRAETGFRLLLLLLPVALLLVLRHMFSVDGRFVGRLPQPDQEEMRGARSSPWGVAALVVVLLVMVSYQSSFHSHWFRPWRTEY